MKAVVWEHDLIVREVPVPPIPEGWVLGKVISAMLSPIDRSATVGAQPLPPGRIMGSYGVIRVVEPGIGSGAGPGELYGVQPYCEDSILGVNLDGTMGEYASVPSSCLIKLRNNLLSERTPLWIEFSFIDQLKELARRSESTLLVGCSFTAYIIANSLRNVADFNVACVERALMKEISELGVPVKKIINLGEKKYDLVVLEPTSAYYSMKALTLLKKDGTLYVPPTHTKLQLEYSGHPMSFNVVRAVIGDIESGKQAIETINKKVLSSAVVTTENMEEVPLLAKYFGRVIYAQKKA